jgi:hypothetical protein
MANTLDDEILEVFKTFDPANGYLMGFDECAGKFFVPSQENVDATLSKIRDLRARAENELQRKVLDSAETKLRFDEPQPVLEDMVNTIFALLVKEGINGEHLLPLLRDAMDALDASQKKYGQRSVPVGVKALVLYRLGSVVELLDTVKEQSGNPEVKETCDALKAKATEYVHLFDLEGFGRGEFPNVEKIFRREGFDLGRQSFYLDALSRALDYGETAEELERKAISWIDEELPKFRKATTTLAKKLGCRPVPEEVEAAINARMKLDPKQLVKTTQKIRKVVQPFVNQHVHGINPKYRTKLIETPPYLTGLIPTGAAMFFDTFTRKPFQVFFQTTDPKRDPDKSVTALMNLLVHEEYGHCVHHSNSVVGFVGKVPALQLLHTLPIGGPITEGLSFNREIEFLEASKRLEAKRKISKTEKDYVKLMEKYGGLELINLELEFWTRRWRLVRFLRVVGDVRINTGKQELLDFVDWANGYTGVPRSSVYFQLFPAHEGMFPGYATDYAVVGQEIRALERKIKDDKKRVKFSTYLCSIGFPPRSIYVRMLKGYLKKPR